MARILAINHEQGSPSAIADLVKKCMPDCHVVTARLGPDCIEYARAESPDTILLDMGTATTDALQMCKAFKSLNETSHVPIIVMTADKTDLPKRKEALKAGADAFLTKPVDEAELVAQLNLALRYKEAGDLLRNNLTLLERTVQDRTRALREREQELTIRNRIAQILLTTANETLYEEVLRVVLEAMDSRYGAFGVIDQDGAMVVPSRSGEVWEGCQVQDDQMFVPRRMWGGIWSESILTRRTICMNEPVQIPDGHPPVTRILVVPITYHGAVIGILEVADKPKNYDDKDLGLLETISDRIAPVLHGVLQSKREERERKQVQEETRRLETRLRQAQKIQAIGTLAGGIAHDFNNILAAIMGYAELVGLQIPEGSRAKDHLRQVLISTYRARDLVKQILTFSRQTEQERRPVYVHLIAKEALKLLRSSLPSTIEIRQNIVSDLSAVMADPSEVHQILMNLCTNAHEAMRKNGGVLEVTLAPVDLGVGDGAKYPDVRPGPYLRLSVADTGHGMNRQTVERIFDPYFTTKEKGEGTGLGLSVVHGIVANLGGTIDVCSEPGQGSIFHVLLPRVEVRHKEETEKRPPLARGNERVLFIDDEEPLVDSGQEMLTHLGYRVITKTNSLEALELFREHPGEFDLVITDMTMPRMTGDKLAKELMRIRSDIPIILCTGFSECITREEATKAGVKAFLMKPIASVEMAQVIRGVLSDSQAEHLNGE